MGTVRSVFPYTALVRISEADTVLLASREPIIPTRGVLDEAQRAVLASPEIRRDLSQYFSEVNHQPERSPRFNVVFDDARSYMNGTASTFDLIL
ncbi:MAG: hypothetical protein ACYS8K_07950, partial [Planctomycetota bacterium]